MNTGLVKKPVVPARNWRKKLLGPMAALWTAAMREVRREPKRNPFIARVTWDFGKTWKDWPWN
jgi:hypothetical protein